MNDLRKWLSDELIDHAKNYERAFDSDRVERTHEATGRILALVAEAMLSDEAKIAASRQMHELSMIGVWDNKVFAHEGIEAALTAAGITGAGQEGGGE